jgi:exoribonuclease R
VSTDRNRGGDGPCGDVGSECPACGTHLYRTADEYTHQCLPSGKVRYAVYFAHPTGDYVLTSAGYGEVTAYLREVWDACNYRVIKFVGHATIGTAQEDEMTWGDLWLEEVEG